MLNIADDKFVDMDLCYLKTEEILLKNHLERLTFLTKSSYHVEEKDVYAKLGDNVSLTLPCSLKFVAPCVCMSDILMVLPTCRGMNASVMR